MFDLRDYKTIDLSNATILKEGKAYKVIDEVTGKKLVVKLMESMGSAEADLIVEFRKLALLSSEPEFGTIGYLAECLFKGEKLTCYVMDFIEGESLETLLAGKEPINEEIAFDIICQMASGLEKLHAAGIFHSDFHDGNIIIDKTLNIKIIDPLWRDVKYEVLEKQKYDMESFRKLVDDLCAKIEERHQLKLRIIQKVCNSTNSFKGLKRKLEELWMVSKELAFLSNDAVELLCVVYQRTSENFKLNMIIHLKDVNVPEQWMPPLTSEEEQFLKPDSNFNKLGISPIDTRINRIKIESRFRVKFHELKMAGLCDYEVACKNVGKALHGPYTFSYNIKITLKALSWFRINREINFLQAMHNKQFTNLYWGK